MVNPINLAKDAPCTLPFPVLISNTVVVVDSVAALSHLRSTSLNEELYFPTPIFLNLALANANLPSVNYIFPPVPTPDALAPSTPIYWQNPSPSMNFYFPTVTTT